MSELRIKRIIGDYVLDQPKVIRKIKTGFGRDGFSDQEFNVLSEFMFDMINEFELCNQSPKPADPRAGLRTVEYWDQYTDASGAKNWMKGYFHGVDSSGAYIETEDRKMVCINIHNFRFAGIEAQND